MNFSFHIFWVAFGLLTQANQAFAVDLQLGEIRALQPDTSLLMLFYQQSERGNRYLHGDKLSDNPEIQSSQLKVRLGRSFKPAEHPAIFYVQSYHVAMWW